MGWGAFVLPTDWLGTAGPLGAVLGFLAGGTLMLVIAVAYGLLIRHFPVSGGEFAYTLKGFGRGHAFLCGWFLTLSYVCVVALNASALALLSRFVLPQVAQRGLLYQVAGWDVYLGEVLIASAALVVFAWLNVRGATLSGRLQYVFVLVMLAGVALLAVAVLLHPDTQLANLRPAFPEGVPPWSAVLAIVAIAPWAYVGFDNVPQAAEEFDFPPAKAFRLIAFAIATATLIYAAIILTTALSTPWTHLVAGQSAWGTGDAMAGLLGGLGTLLLALSLMMGVFTGLNGFYVASSRLMFAMGRARVLPRAFCRPHPRNRTPTVGILFAGALCLVAPWFGREALLWVVDMSAVGVAIAYTYTCLVAFQRFRWTAGRAGAGDGAHSSPRKVLSLAGAVTGLVFLGLLLLPFSPAALGPESWAALVVWTVLGAVFYAARRARGDRLSDEELDYLVFGAGLDPQPSAPEETEDGGARSARSPAE